VIAISSATALGQLIAIASAPLLTRLFSPHDYGAFFMINSASLVLAAGFAMRLELAVPLPSDDDDARRLVALALSAIGVLLVIVAAVSFALRQSIAAAFGLGDSPWIVMMIGPVTASFALFAVLNAVAARERRYGAIARRQLVVAVATVILQVLSGLVGSGVGGLLLSALVAQVLGAASLFWGSKLMADRLDATRVGLGRTLRRYRSFPLALAPAGWLNSLGANAPLLIVGVLYSTDAAGWFGLTLRIVALPATLIGSAIAQVFVSELAFRRRQGSGTERVLFRKTSMSLTVAAVLFGASLAAVGPWLFGLVFGSEWSPAGDMARAYALAAAAQMLASPVSQTLIVYERAIAQVVWDGSRLLLTLSSLFIAWRLGGSAVMAVWALSVSTALCYVVNWEVCRRTVLNADRSKSHVDS
jgi:O-antigen/teichoic acid export membrane protein